MDRDLDDLLSRMTDEIKALRGQVALLQQQEHKHIWLATSLTDPGWMPLPVTTGNFVNATSFTMFGDLTNFFKIGTKVRLFNTTLKYGYVLSSSYNGGTGLTTVNLIANTSFSLANVAISDIKVSYGIPPDFPPMLVYSGAATGYSAIDFQNYRFNLNNGLVTVVYRIDGTSNATTLTFAAPIAALSTGYSTYNPVFVLDNGVGQPTPGSTAIASGSTTVTVGRQYHTGGGFTASGRKFASGVLHYFYG